MTLQKKGSQKTAVFVHMEHPQTSVDFLLLSSLVGQFSKSSGS